MSADRPGPDAGGPPEAPTGGREAAARPPAGDGSDSLLPPASRPLAPWPRLVAAVTGRATGGEPLRLITVLGRHPRLFRRWLPFAATLLLRGDLPAADRELVILRTAWRSASAYEWAHHVPRARRAGLSADAVAATATAVAGGSGGAGSGGAGWSTRQRALLRAVDDIHDRGVVTGGTWTDLTGALTERELIELCLLVGHYRMLAATLASLGVAPEPSALAHLDGPTSRAAGELADEVTARRDAGDGAAGDGATDSPG